MCSRWCRRPLVERNGEISPDGRWLAYESNDSGQFQIFVRPFPDVNKGKWQVSTAGGTQPLWARNGQELFYLAPSGALMSVPVERGTTWTAGTPTRLIDAQYYVGVGTNVARTYDVSPDGKRFLMIKEGAAPTKPHAGQHRRRPELVRGAEAPRADGTMRSATRQNYCFFAGSCSAARFS